MVGYQMLGRRFFDPQQAAFIREYGLEVWPGFSTSVDIKSAGLLIQIDTSNRVLRTDSMLDHLRKLYTEAQAKHQDPVQYIKKKIVGQIALTRYNNRTYVIDDVDFTQNPTRTFQSGQGVVSYVQYYQ